MSRRFKLIRSNRFKLVLSCALFNLLFEYSARGVDVFISRPLFVLTLFGVYLTYFAMLEDLIVRYKLTNLQIFLAAFIYGLFPITFHTGNMFHDEIYGGIILGGVNVGTVFVIGILAWGVLQAMITLYLANRLSPRDWEHPRMGPAGWVLCVAFQVVVAILAHRVEAMPRGTVVGYLVFAFLETVAVVLLVLSMRAGRRQAWPFERSWVMDVLAFGSVVVFLSLGTFLAFDEKVVTSQPLNRLAVTLENVWVALCAVVFFVYRLARRTDVTV